MLIIDHAWNTGRSYTASGQRIAAEYDLETDRIYFVDVDRHIEGSFPRPGFVAPEEMDETKVERFTMSAYDGNRYDSIHLTREDPRTRRLYDAAHAAPV